MLGELHHPTAPCESERPSWLVIPETGLYAGVLIVGAVGSGKTSACMYPFAQQMLSWQAEQRLMLIVLGGLPGVGKSALARSLAQRIGAVLLRIDPIEQAMRNAGLIVSGPQGYLAVRDHSQDNLRMGQTVVVDAVNPSGDHSQLLARVRGAREGETRGD